MGDPTGSYIIHAKADPAVGQFLATSTVYAGSRMFKRRSVGSVAPEIPLFERRGDV